MYRQWCWCGQSYLFYKGLLCVPQLLWFGQVQNKNHWHITSEWIMKETTWGHSAWTTHVSSFSWPDVVCCHRHFNQFGEKGATTKLPEMGHIFCLYRRAIHSICWCGQHLALNKFRGENRGKWKGWQPLRVEPRTPLAWAASDLPLSNDSQTTTNPHNPSMSWWFWRHILSGCNWSIQYHLCRTCRGLWGLVVVWLSWLSMREDALSIWSLALNVIAWVCTYITATSWGIVWNWYLSF